jgi:hypothetical protein
MIVLVVIWATSEYHNAGGWPVDGLSQSSGIHDVWNYWIVYPLGAWVLLTAASAWFVYQKTPGVRAALPPPFSRGHWAAARGPWS